MVIFNSYVKLPEGTTDDGWRFIDYRATNGKFVDGFSGMAVVPSDNQSTKHVILHGMISGSAGQQGSAQLISWDA